MAENIMAFAIVFLVSAVIFILGISQIKSNEPVGFYTFEKVPEKEQLSNVSEWNKKHGCMLIAYSIATVISFLICLIFDYHMVAFIAFFCVIIGFIPPMMLYHRYLKKKYYR